MADILSPTGIEKPLGAELHSRAMVNRNYDRINAGIGAVNYRESNYTPVFNGISNLGTSPVISGSYVRVGKLVTASFYLKAGAGALLGTAFVTVSLPFQAATAPEKTFGGYAGLHAPGITGIIYLLTPVISSSAADVFLFAIDNANKNELLSPGAKLYPFGADDVIRGSVTYLTDIP